MKNSEHDDFDIQVAPLQESDDLDVQITPLQGPRPSGKVSLPIKLLTHLATQCRASSRRKPVMYAAIALSLVLLLAMVTRYSFPLSRSGTGQQNSTIPPLPPGYNNFYMQAAVPWMQVFVDGQQVKPPRPASNVPLTLKPGHHRISWHADPFQPQSCRLSVPYAVGDSCEFAREDVTPIGSSAPLQVILLQESLLTLPTSQQDALLHAIQASLDSIPASQQVQAGERYLVNSGNGVATQPLLARLRISLDTSSGNDCTLDVESMAPQPCAIDGQDCTKLCTMPWQVQQAALSAFGSIHLVPGGNASPSTAPHAAVWSAFASVHLTWDYATLQGQTIASNQPIDDSGANYAPTSDQLMLLNITWQNGDWQVHPLLGPDLHSPMMVNSGALGQSAGSNIQLADDPACVAAQDVFAQLTVNTPSLLNAPSQQFHYLSNANPAAGCLVVLSATLPYAGNYSSGTPIAWQSPVFLERFGVTLAVNDAAHQLEPDIPIANASEKTLAAQLAATAWQIGFTPDGNSP